MPIENRRHPRLECVGVASIQVQADEPVHSAKIVNLSVEGCLLDLQEPKKLTADLLVELTFSINNLPFRVRGQVKIIHSDTRVGFYFPALSQRVRLQLTDLSEELTEDQQKRISKATSPAVG